MPNFPWLGRQDASAIDDAALAAILSGPEVPEDLAAGLQPAADVLAALRARPSGDELAGEAFAMAEFRNQVGVPDRVRRTRPRRRPALLTSLMSAKIAVATAAVAITIGGVATAAYAGALPAPAQRLAHDVIGAPAGPQRLALVRAGRCCPAVRSPPAIPPPLRVARLLVPEASPVRDPEAAPILDTEAARILDRDSPPVLDAKTARILDTRTAPDLHAGSASDWHAAVADAEAAPVLCARQVPAPSSPAPSALSGTRARPAPDRFAVSVAEPGPRSAAVRTGLNAPVCRPEKTGVAPAPA